MRKSLSECHTLALSFIFLISSQSTIFSKMKFNEKVALMKNLDVNKNLKVMEESTILTYYQTTQALQQFGIDEDEAMSEMENIRSSCSGHEAKMAVRAELLNFSSNQCESNLIIETLRSFLINCVISLGKNTKH
ncbi:hypothetical protein BCV72DRAFT_316867 [Rhizopus microsporus var. microsporus]|uniref:Uncharacterized protein n=2 Tax=Rhizopus microsporus TaxID=58291 RepID=A0A2G4T2D9_RHIZD|nr:uncharacterized protein RHIMIDRAFT_311304 [Rhizopus microsporus ATCC 52813]ORE09974.1 hypothetical protein BCV72DRAFT_316867 [Rhizopus microsporus var. microsporus]PHZ15181.1 hypothetical protein RHIMIDRAFT_311304 [Rhizopus microsporus ATCC 52813]